MRGQPLRRPLAAWLLATAPAALLLLSSLKPEAALGQAQILEAHATLGNLDSRKGLIKPTSAQLGIVSGLGATAAWNRFGTPSSLLRPGGFLATGLTGEEATAARRFVRQNRGLFRLSDRAVTELDVVGDTRLAENAGRVVLFRQRYGGLPAGVDGLIGVTVSKGRIAYVWSSATGDGAAPTAPVLSAVEAWRKAAASVDRGVGGGAISNVRADRGWTLFDVAGFSHPQRSRLVAVPTLSDGVRPAYDTLVLHVAGGEAIAYSVFVDAATGAVLLRHNRVDQLARLDGPAREIGLTPAVAGLVAAVVDKGDTTYTFEGEYQDDPNDVNVVCGDPHPFDVPAGVTQIVVSATAAVVTNDIVLKLIPPSGPEISVDTGLSPEALTHQPDPALLPGIYAVQVCPLKDSINPQPMEPYTYVGTFTTSSAPVTANVYPPKWNLFVANPPFPPLSGDTRTLACWVAVVNAIPVPGCESPLKVLQNLAARFPWDMDTRANQPTFTTIGNAAMTAEAWGSPLTPAEPYRPVAPNRIYDFPWTDQWLASKCNPTSFALPERNDIDAAVTNLFAMHNRMHDWSYFLGFTEEAFNLQNNNFGNRPPAGIVPTNGEFDPEVGNAQAGAISGGSPSYLGRDNANQITLFDGIPGITNMYLWQPIAASFYAPCVDGDYDMSVIGHEYTHAISNRMVGGPDNGIISDQGSAMGESWSDLFAVEYLNEYRFAPIAGENPFAVGPYVTGALQTGIRNYAMNASPLNYSDVGYDFICNNPLTNVFNLCLAFTQSHADGEIWSATNFDIRKALIAKYNSGFPASKATLQRDCADGKLPASHCPGNRRWIQLVTDAFLMLPSDLSMLDARNALLAADVVRFGGANQTLLWNAFAKRGFGVGASTQPGGDDVDPVPSFEAPPPAPKATITFKALAWEEGMAKVENARVYVGRYEARVTPIADTDPASPLSATAAFVPGSYDFLVVAPGFGHFRFTKGLTSGQTETLNVYLPSNWASKHRGATATGDGINKSKLIDDTEATNWARLLSSPVPAVDGVQVTVKLAGIDTFGPRPVRRVKVSAMLRPRDETDQGEPGDANGDSLGQNRFSALRSFEIWTCTQSPTNPNCVNPAGFTKMFTSALDAFPADQPRPLAPDLIVREFDIDNHKATHVRLVVKSNQCTGGPAYQGDQDNDPLNDSDCVTGSASPSRRSPQGGNVRAAELQVFSHGGGAGTPPRDPLVLLAMAGPLTTSAGSPVEYEITYSNAGPSPSKGARVIDTLPGELTFVSASNGGSFDPGTRKVTWNLGTVTPTFTGTLRLKARVAAGTTIGTEIVNQAEFKGQLTVSPPAAVAVTTVLP